MTNRERDDLLSIAADCREAARWTRGSHERATAMAERIIARLRSLIRGRPWKHAFWADRLASNLSAGCRLAACCPDVLGGYLRGAADELEALAGATEEAEETPVQ